MHETSPVLAVWLSPKTTTLIVVVTFKERRFPSPISLETFSVRNEFFHPNENFA